MGYATTSHLWLYDSHLSGAVDVSSVEEALAQPGTAVLVVQDYELAREILIAQGLDDERADYWINVGKRREASGVPD